MTFSSAAGGETLFVPVLRETIQNQCSLQKAHESAHWKPDCPEPNW